MSDQLERNKKNVTAFYDLILNQNNPTDAIKRYVGEVYIQHNPALAEGQGSFFQKPVEIKDLVRRINAEVEQ